MVRKWSIEDFRHMSVDERLKLIDDLWESIDEQSAAAQALTEEQVIELEARLAKSDQSPGAGSSWDEVERRILNRKS